MANPKRIAEPVAITIYGASDDLIEVNGDVLGCDEFNAEEGYVELSTADVFHVKYTNEGVWKVRHHVIGVPKIKVETEPHAPTEGNDDPEPYTDTATITGRISWVRFCKVWPMDDESKREAVKAWIDRYDFCELPMPIVEQMYQTLTTTSRR